MNNKTFLISEKKTKSLFFYSPPIYKGHRAAANQTESNHLSFHKKNEGIFHDYIMNMQIT